MANIFENRCKDKCETDLGRPMKIGRARKLLSKKFIKR